MYYKVANCIDRILYMIDMKRKIIVIELEMLTIHVLFRIGCIAINSKLMDLIKLYILTILTLYFQLSII